MLSSSHSLQRTQFTIDNLTDRKKKLFRGYHDIGSSSSSSSRRPKPPSIMQFRSGLGDHSHRAELYQIASCTGIFATHGEMYFQKSKTLISKAHTMVASSHNCFHGTTWPAVTPRKYSHTSPTYGCSPYKFHLPLHSP